MDDIRPLARPAPAASKPTTPAEADAKTSKKPKGRFRQALDIGQRLAAFTGSGSRINNTTAILMIAVAFFVFNLPQIIVEWLLIGVLFNWIISNIWVVFIISLVKPAPFYICRNIYCGIILLFYI